MQRDRLIGFAVITVLASCAALLAASGQTRYTGTPADIMRVRVVNSGHGEAVPVSLLDSAVPLKVEVTNKATVLVDPSTVVTARIQPRTWEYKVVRISVADWDAAARTLNTEGAQGWETTGVTSSTASGTTLVLKRQK